MYVINIMRYNKCMSEMFKSPDGKRLDTRSISSVNGGSQVRQIKLHSGHLVLLHGIVHVHVLG